MNTSLTAPSMVRRRLLQAGWLMGFTSIALGFVALILGSWQLWLAVTLLAGSAALMVMLAPAVVESETGNEGPAILFAGNDSDFDRTAA